MANTTVTVNDPADVAYLTEGFRTSDGSLTGTSFETSLDKSPEATVGLRYLTSGEERYQRRSFAIFYGPVPIDRGVVVVSAALNCEFSTSNTADGNPGAQANLYRRLRRYVAIASALPANAAAFNAMLASSLGYDEPDYVTGSSPCSALVAAAIGEASWVSGSGIVFLYQWTNDPYNAADTAPNADQNFRDLAELNYTQEGTLYYQNIVEPLPDLEIVYDPALVRFHGGATLTPTFGSAVEYRRRFDGGVAAGGVASVRAEYYATASGGAALGGSFPAGRIAVMSGGVRLAKPYTEYALRLPAGKVAADVGYLWVPVYFRLSPTVPAASVDFVDSSGKKVPSIIRSFAGRELHAWVYLRPSPTQNVDFRMRLS